MQYTKKYIGLPPAANGIDDGKWWPWAVVMHYSDGRIQEKLFNTEAQADDYLSKQPAESVIPIDQASWAV